MTASADTIFNPRMVLWAVLASLLAAAGFFLLSTYAPDFRLSGAGGATPLSKSGVGFAGLVELLSQTDAPPVMARNDADLDSAALLVVPLSPDTPPDALKRLIAHRIYKTTLYILPKWEVTAMLDHPGWDLAVGHLSTGQIDRVLRRIAASNTRWSAAGPKRLAIAGLSVRAPEEMQTIADPQPVIAAGPGRALLAKEDGAPHYILSDPDLLNNQGLADTARAAAALRIIARLKPNDEPVMIDLTLAGAGPSRSLQKLLVEPPFLALTLTLLAAAVLAFAHGFVRFGPPAVEARAIAFGKYALADTTARLFRRAGRLGGLGERYAALMRMRAGVLLGAPAGLSPAALKGWLDKREPEDDGAFGDLEAATEAATGEAELQARALALHSWIHRRKRDR